MGRFVAPAYPDQPSVAERVSDAEYSTDPGRYRRTGEIPRQRVAFVPEGESEAPVSGGMPGSGPDMYQQDWSHGKRRKGRRRARGRTGRTVTLLVAVTTV